MGLTVTKAKFNYSSSDEPHATRRLEILKAHPEIKQLFGIDPAFKYVVAAMVLTQTIIAYMLRGL
jgi:sphingolipid delta-4 desaturase